MHHWGRSRVFRPADDKSPAPSRAGGTTPPSLDSAETQDQAEGRRNEANDFQGLPLPDTHRSPSVGSVEMARRKASSGQTVLDEAVITRLHVLATEGAHGSNPKMDRKLGRCSRFKAKALASALATALLLLLLLVAYLVFRGTIGARELARISTCRSTACALLADAVLSQLNHSIHPCHDIEAHVCSHLRWGGGLDIDTQTDMMTQWHMRGAAYLETRRKPEAAFALYRACMEPSQKGISDLTAFMRQRGLLWPEYGSTGRHALYVVFDLAINWGVPFWFEMSLRKLPNKTRYSIYINRVKTKEKWKKRQQASGDRLAQYAKDLHSVFHASEEARARIPKLLKLEAFMYDLIMPQDIRESNDSTAVTVIAVPVVQISLLTPNISVYTWLKYMNEFLNPYRVQADDKVLLDDTELPRSMNRLLSLFSNDDVLYTLGWWFAQHFAVFVSLDGGLASYGSVSLAQLNRPIDCYALAESRFRRQLFADRAQASLGITGMRRAAQLLAQMRNTTAALLGSLSWLDEEAREQAVAILQATQFEPWTSEFRFDTVSSSLAPRRGSEKSDKTQTANRGAAPSSVSAIARRGIQSSQANISSAGADDGSSADAEGAAARTGRSLFGLDAAHQFTEALARSLSFKHHSTLESLVHGTFDVHHEHAAQHGTAIEHWAEAAVKYKRTFPNWPLDDSLLHRHLSPALLAHYDYWWNSMFLQMAAFTVPIFYPDASISANYGGLGYLVAKYLVKAFDFRRGIWLDAQRRRREWINQKSRQTYERKITCTGGDSRVLMRVAALEIALAAFRSTANEREGAKKERDERRSFPGGKEAFSPEMIFFLVYCRVACGSELGCGTVLKHVELFGAAFQCPKGSAMTSSMSKCSFFED